MVGCLGFQEQIVLFKCVCCLVFMVVFAVPCFSSWTVLFAQFFNRFSSPFCTKHASKSTHYLSRKKKGTTAFKKWAGEKKKHIHSFWSQANCMFFFPKTAQRCEADMISFSICLGAGNFHLHFLQKSSGCLALVFFVVRWKDGLEKLEKFGTKIECERERFQVMISSVYFSMAYQHLPRGFVWIPGMVYGHPLSSIQHPLEDPGNQFRVFSIGLKNSLWDVITYDNLEWKYHQKWTRNYHPNFNRDCHRLLV